MIKNDGNKNNIERKKYTVKLSGVPLFPKLSTLTVSGNTQPMFETIQLNEIIPECEFTGSLD
jgi:hypothetical protein